MGKLFESFLIDDDSNYYIEQMKNKKMRLMDIPKEYWTKEFLLKSVEYTGYQALRTMERKMLDYDICLLAVKIDAGSCFEYTPIELRSEELQLLAVDRWCTHINVIKNPSKEVCIRAVEAAIRDNKSDEWFCIEAVRKNAASTFPIKDWPLTWFKYIVNVETKRQFIREHGIKVFKQLDNLKLIEEDNEYCLIRYNLVDRDVEPNKALIYRCPTSKDTYFTEVPKVINTIRVALSFMNNGVAKEEFAMES